MSDIEQLGSNQLLLITSGHCPDCVHRGFVIGPMAHGQTVTSINVECGSKSCRSRFNVSFFGGKAIFGQRIAREHYSEWPSDRSLPQMTKKDRRDAEIRRLLEPHKTHVAKHDEHRHAGIKHYILDDEHHVVEVDLMTWARWFEHWEKRRVGETTLQFVSISTVFLGLDHNWSGRGPPILFETMVFGDEKHMHPRLKQMIRDEVDCWRYSSWDDAVAGHEVAVRRYQRIEEQAAKIAVAGARRQRRQDHDKDR